VKKGGVDEYGETGKAKERDQRGGEKEGIGGSKKQSGRGERTGGGRRRQ